MENRLNYSATNGLGAKALRSRGTIATRTEAMGITTARRGFCDDGGLPIDPSWLDYNIRRRGSHIYFYEEINEVTQMILEVMLKDAVRDVLTEHVGEILGGELPESVTIHVNSPGGYLNCGFALYDYIKTSQIPITCVVEGLCASAATLIMLACPVRVMSPNSVYLMHQCSWGCWGENRFMQDHADNAQKAMKKLRTIYLAETKIADGKSDKEREAYIQHLLEHDYELDADECEKLGITSPHDDDDDDVELSDERVAKLQDFIKKLAADQKKENAAKAKEEVDGKAKKSTKKAEPKTEKKPTKKAPAKKPAKKDEPVESPTEE